MATEIERKFLVNKEKWNAVVKGTGSFYQQGYLLTDPAKTIRVRLTDDAAFITIKGPGNGASRPEYEYAVPRQDAAELLASYCTAIITKRRYKLTVAEKLWEVDEFMGSNEGLIVAEIELQKEDEAFTLPEWVAHEVTGEAKYYNASLSHFPYKHWTNR